MSEKGAVVKSKKRISWSTLLIFLFLIIIVFLVYTSFYNPEFIQNVTGNVIKEEIFNGIPIEADIDSPENLKMTTNADKIELKISGSFFVDNKRYDLSTASLVIDNFDGNVNLDSRNVIVNGKATKIFIEGIPITGKLKVSINNKYSYLKMNNVYIQSLSYDTSGIVKLEENKIVVNLNEDSFSFSEFIGNIEKSGTNFKIDGSAEEVSAGSINIKADSN